MCVFTAPSRPRNVKATPVNSTTIFITWDVPEIQNGIIRSYVVFYNTSGEHNGMAGEIDTMDSSTRLLVDSLTPFTEYGVFVAAVTVERGPSSVVVMVRTNESGKLHEYC